MTTIKASYSLAKTSMKKKVSSKLYVDKSVDIYCKNSFFLSLIFTIKKKIVIFVKIILIFTIFHYDFEA